MLKLVLPKASVVMAHKFMSPLYHVLKINLIYCNYKDWRDSGHLVIKALIRC